MPAHVTKRGDKFRVVEKGGKLVRNDSGTPIDGGGHKTERMAQKQASAVNISQARKRGADIPKQKMKGAKFE